MVGQRIKYKSANYISRKFLKREGTIIGETGKKTGWWVRWDGNKGNRKVLKNHVEITSNIADIVQDLLFHKQKH